MSPFAWFFVGFCVGAAYMVMVLSLQERTRKSLSADGNEEGE